MRYALVFITSPMTLQFIVSREKDLRYETIQSLTEWKLISSVQLTNIIRDGFEILRIQYT